MLIDARTAPPHTRFRADVCVIGTGPAGATVAEELAGRGLDVLVLEGGGTRPDARHDDTYTGEVATADGTGHDPLQAVRLKQLGGSSMAWGGRCSPLDELDLQVRDWIPDSGWPITSADLAPYYERAQRLLDAGTYDYSAHSSGLGRGLDGGDGVLDADQLWRWSPPTTYASRMTALAGRANVRVLTDATVTRLDRDPVGGAVTGAVVVPRPGVELDVRATTFVLAAGGLESTRILLASDAQTPGGIGDEHGQLGRHYMTHPVGEVGRVVLGDAGRALALGYEKAFDGVYARRMLTLSAETQRRHELTNLKVALWFADPMDPAHGDGLLSTFSLTYWAMARARAGFKASGTHAMYAGTEGIGRHVRNVAADAGRVGRFTASWAWPRLTGKRILPSFMPLDSAWCRLRFDAEQAPDPANRVTLSPERDALGQRRLHVDYRVSATDRERIRTGMTLIGERFAAAGLGTVDLSDVATIDDRPFTDGTHQMGLLRMSRTPAGGVVDEQCRVHGAANLYVAGSAVFPTGGAVGPTLTIVALACRIADHIAGR